MRSILFGVTKLVSQYIKNISKHTTASSFQLALHTLHKPAEEAEHPPIDCSYLRHSSHTTNDTLTITTHTQVYLEPLAMAGQAERPGNKQNATLVSSLLR